MPKAVITTTTPDDIKRRLPAVPASLDARFVRLAQPIAVTFAKPVEHGRPQEIAGDLLGTMFARGAIHHYRVAADGVVWIVPPIWLTPASAVALGKAMRPTSADDILIERMRGLLATLRERNRRAGV